MTRPPEPNTIPPFLVQVNLDPVGRRAVRAGHQGVGRLGGQGTVIGGAPRWLCGRPWRPCFPGVLDLRSVGPRVASRDEPELALRGW